MEINVSGKQIDLSDALRTRVATHLEGIARKYFDRALDAQVTFGRARSFFTCDINLHAGRGLSDAKAEASYEMRYRGQAFELTVAGALDPDPADLAERFAAAHEERYGYRENGGEIELVDIRVAMVVPGPRLQPSAATSADLDEGSRRARFDGAWVDARILRGEPAAGARTEGPAIFELPEATLVLPPSWLAEVDKAGTIRAEAVQ